MISSSHWFDTEDRPIGVICGVVIPAHHLVGLHAEQGCAIEQSPHHFAAPLLKYEGLVNPPMGGGVGGPPGTDLPQGAFPSAVHRAGMRV